MKETKTKPLKAWKGFSRDMKCREFQYVEGETYTELKAKLCNTGFHAVLLPLDVFTYYPPATSLYHEVLLGEVSEQTEKDSKRVGKEITIGVSLGIPGLIRAHVEAVWEKAKTADPSVGAKATTGRYANAATTGYSANVRAQVKDEGAIAAIIGEGAAAGVKGCWLVLTERDRNLNILGVQAVPVDGKKIKENVFYTLKGDKIVKVAE